MTIKEFKNMILDGIATYTFLPKKKTPEDYERYFAEVYSMTDKELEEKIERQKKTGIGQVIGIIFFIIIGLSSIGFVSAGYEFIGVVLGLIPMSLIVYAKEIHKGC